MIDRFVRAAILTGIFLASSTALPSPPPTERKAEDTLVAASCTDREGSVRQFQDVGIRSSSGLARYLTVERAGHREQVLLADIAELTIDNGPRPGPSAPGMIRRVGRQPEEVLIVVRDGGDKKGPFLLLSSTTDSKRDVPLYQCAMISFRVLRV